MASKVQSSVVTCQLAGTSAEEKATNPYRPSVGAYPSNDIPLIVKGSEKFPAIGGGSRSRSQVSPGGYRGETLRLGLDSHKYAIRDVPELDERHC